MNEAFFDELSKIAEVIGHIVGASGAGKTTLLNKLQAKHPNLVTKDTDEWHDATHAKMGLGKERPDKDAYRKVYSDIARKFLKQHKDSPVLLGGGMGTIPGVEITGDKMLLGTGALKSSWRRYRRKNARPWLGPEGKRMGKLKDLPRNVIRARRHIKEFKRRGYAPMSSGQISDVVEARLRERQ